MKKLFLILLPVLFFSIAFAQAGDVPEDVQKAFSRKFSGSQNVNWTVEASTLYKATFKDSRGRSADAVYDSFGKWLYSVIHISEADIPKAAFQTINSGYPGFSVLSAVKNELPDNVSRYVVQIQKGQETKGLVFDPSGKFIGIEMPSVTQR